MAEVCISKKEKVKNDVLIINTFNRRNITLNISSNESINIHEPLSKILSYKHVFSVFFNGKALKNKNWDKESQLAKFVRQ